MKVNEYQNQVFECFDTELAKVGADILGLWTTKPLVSNEGLSFDAASTTTSSPPVWRANLPADLTLAATYFTNGTAKLEESLKGLTAATSRIDILTANRSVGSGTDIAFDISSTGTKLAEPERELLETLQTIRGLGTDVSFGLGEQISGQWRQTTEQFQVLTERLINVVANYAWVETQIQAQILARTAVGWTGDVNTVWRDGVNSKQISLHHSTLALALESRKRLIQTFTTAVQATVKLSVLVTMPGGTTLALPVVWRFINRVMAQNSATRILSE